MDLVNPEFDRDCSFDGEIHSFERSDSYKLLLFLRENRILMTILTGNYRELCKILEFHNSAPVEKKLWNPNPTFRFRLQKRIIRHLTNYLNSIFVIVDYSRNSIKEYLEEDKIVIAEYNNEKEFFLKDINHQFIQGLRNYTNHNTFIKIGSEISYSIEWTGPRKGIYVKKEELLKWNGWHSLAKNFIKSQGDKIRLNEILETHYNEFSSFQNRVYLKILMVNKERTLKLLVDTEAINNWAESTNNSQRIIFNNAYIRYLKYIYRKALSKN